jgi:hypothetical protein
VGTGGSTAGRGGTTGTGGGSGTVGTGGSTGRGGTTGTGGGPGTGGSTAGRGGTTGSGGGTGTNCVDDVRVMGYAYPPAAMPCSACMDNQTSLETKCKAMIDCLVTKYPCLTGQCLTDCLNTAQGSAVVSNCATALTTAACN